MSRVSGSDTVKQCSCTFARNALAGCTNKDRKQGSEELCGPGHERWATKPSSCSSKVTVFVSLTRESCTFCVDIDFLRSTKAS